MDGRFFQNLKNKGNVQTFVVLPAGPALGLTVLKTTKELRGKK
jgi:hypothetical protein